MSTAEAGRAPAVLRAAALGIADRLHTPVRSATTWVTIAFLGVALAVRTCAFVASPTVTYPDTEAYLQLAADRFTDLTWWTGLHPATVPLVYRLAGDTVAGAVLFQLVFAAFAWSVLALAVARVVQTAWLKPVALALVLAFGLSREIVEWDRIALSESIALSIFALLSAALILYVERPGRVVLGAALAAGVLWAFSRDVNAYELLFAVPLLAIAAVIRPGRRALHGAAAAGCLGIFALSFASASASMRWEYPFYGIMDLRILPDATALAYFQQSALPVSPDLLQQRSRSGSELAAYYQDPRLAPVRAWVRAHGRQVYLAYLLTHPDAAIVEPGSQLPDLLSKRKQIQDYAPGTWPGLDGPSAWLFPSRDGPGVLLVAAGVLTAATGALAGWPRRLLVPGLLVATAVPMAMLIYQGAASDLGRLELIPDVQVRLGLWLLVLLTIDVVVVVERRMRTRARTGAA